MLEQQNESVSLYAGIVVGVRRSHKQSSGNRKELPRHQHSMVKYIRQAQYYPRGLLSASPGTAKVQFVGVFVLLQLRKPLLPRALTMAELRSKRPFKSDTI